MTRRRLLLVTHHPLESAGGSSARWRSLTRYLPEAGWEVDVAYDPMRVSVAAYADREEDRARVERRARFWGRVARLTTPPFTLLGIRRSAMPLLAPVIVARGARGLRRRLRAGSYDVVLATGPPMTALLVARAAIGAGSPPLVVELRDLWAGNPSYDRRGGLLGRLERWIFGGAVAVVACTPEAVDDLASRHPEAAARMVEIPNGFEPELLERRRSTAEPHVGPITIVHSGTLVPARPLGPLLEVLAQEPYRSRFRLVHHGYTSRELIEELSSFQERCDLTLLPPSGWSDAVAQMAGADVGLLTNTTAGGDATSVPGKVYEYLALGKPVLCLTEGGAAETLLSRLGAGSLAARIDDPSSIAAALDRLQAGDRPEAAAGNGLARYSRRELASEMAGLLERVSAGG